MAKKPWSQQNYVGLVLFSGAPNPRWPLEIVPKTLIDKLEALPVKQLAPGYLVPNTWYGGIVVHMIDAAGKRRRIVVHDQFVFDTLTDTIRFDQGRQIEQALFATIPGDIVQSIGSLSDDGQQLSFMSLTAVQLHEHHKINGLNGNGPPPECQHAPQFEAPPSRWDCSPGIDDNNCYNYANNEFSVIDDAQPGRRPWSPVSIDEMHNLLLEDGLEPVGADARQLPQHCHIQQGAHLIAVCVRIPDGSGRFKDYHCLRLDQLAGGTRWSHKDGAGASTTKDNRLMELVDLGQGLFKLPQVLVGYYWSLPGARKISFPEHT